jgi:CheY-like chemotaxis protein
MNILVVEDDPIGAELMRAVLCEYLGHTLVGPVALVGEALVAEALALIEHSPPDCAVLNVNLGDRVLVTPVADRLEELSVPFIFVTGNRNPLFPFERFQEHSVLDKPWNMFDLIRLVEGMKRDARDA